MLYILLETYHPIKQEACMTSEKWTRWYAHTCAVVGLLLWIGATLYFKLYPITILIAVTAVPATIYNIVREARSVEPVRR